MATDIQLGDLARDTITGFEGIVIGKTTWLHGCERAILQPRDLKDGKMIDSATFDVPQLELVKAAAATPGSRTTGGPRPDAVRGR